MPLVTGGGRIREAWDTDTYWLVGAPVLALWLAVTGYASEERIHIRISSQYCAGQASTCGLPTLDHHLAGREPGEQRAGGQ